nr:MAG TPA: hypothetical protein [Caudoviricetes sp.]
MSNLIKLMYFSYLHLLSAMSLQATNYFVLSYLH